LSTLIAWCGFVGSWLLVFGPLDQAVRELREEEFGRETLVRVSQQVDAPPPISRRWAFVPPIYIVLLRRRSNAYRKLIAQQLSPNELEAMAHLRGVAVAWTYVAAGAFLLAVSATWVLHEAYSWPAWGFWATVVIMVVLLAIRTALRVQRPDMPPIDQTRHAG
jgi:hypothetical protein